MQSYKIKNTELNLNPVFSIYTKYFIVPYNTAGGYYNAAVNRLYYACYYAASALLLNCEIEANTHNGVKTQLSMHFVRTGHLSLDHGATFSLLFEKRQASDYSDFAYCDLALINTLRPRAEAFINAMEQLINKE